MLGSGSVMRLREEWLTCFARTLLFVLDQLPQQFMSINSTLVSGKCGNAISMIEFAPVLAQMFLEISMSFDFSSTREFDWIYTDLSKVCILCFWWTQIWKLFFSPPSLILIQTLHISLFFSLLPLSLPFSLSITLSLHLPLSSCTTLHEHLSPFLPNTLFFLNPCLLIFIQSNYALDSVLEFSWTSSD